MPLRIACLGDNCIDRFLPPVNHHLAGGNAVNVAVQVARLGQAAEYFGAIGADADGAHLRDELLRNGVGIDGLAIDPDLPTAYTDVATGPDADRHFVHEDFGACAAYRPDAAALEALARCDHIHIGWLNDGGAAKWWLRSSGVAVSQDLSVNARPENLSPAGLSIAFASAEPGREDAHAAELLSQGAVLAVLTLGPAGSFASDGRTVCRAPALAVDPVDTTGAGDAFIAGFLVAHLKGAALPEALASGSRHARSACLHLGGFPQVPRSKFTFL